MPTLWQISDLHIQADPAANALVERRLKRLYSLMAPEDWLLVTGDLTDDGDEDPPAWAKPLLGLIGKATGPNEGQYAEACHLLAPWTGRIIMCPGNHDLGWDGLGYEARAERRWEALCRELGARADLVLGRHRVVGVSSCLRTPNVSDTAKGQLGDRTLWWLADVLRETQAAGLGLIVAHHHHPLNDNPFERLIDARQAHELLWGWARFWLVGHKHEAGTWQCRNGMRTLLHAEVDFRHQPSQPDWVPAFPVGLG